VVWRRGKIRGADSEPSASQQFAAVFSSVPTIDGFRDLTIIGHGSTATVYRAVQDGFDRDVAIKVLHLDISDRRAQKRFQRERSLNGRLSNHPNVVTVLDSGFVAGRHPYLVMEYLEQGSLSDRIKERGPFELALTMHIGVRIAGALETAHRVGVLHRDVKPNNILLSRFEEPALADFGIAAILEMEQSMTAALTPVHAAPELLEGAEPSPQTDVYALGSTLYTLLAGIAPFAGPAGEGMLSQLLRITTSNVPSLARDDTPRELFDLLCESMAKRPDKRISSAGEFGERLQGLQHQFGLAVSALPVDVMSRVAAPTSPLIEPETATETAEPASFTSSTKEAAVDPTGAVALPVTTVENPPIASEPIAETAETAETAELAAVLPDKPDLTDNSTTVTFEPTHASATVTAANATAAEHGVVPVVSFDPHATVSARQLHPLLPVEEHRKRRWWAIPLVVTASIGTAATGTVLLLANGSNDTARAIASTTVEPRPTTTTATDPVTFETPNAPGQSSTTIDYSNYAPTDVKVVAQAGALSVRFTDNTSGQRQHLVKIGRGPTKRPLDPIITRKGQSYLVLPPELTPTEPVCIVVSAVVDAPNRFVEAAPFCLNGGKIS
jgi:serine/threonine-protein kinase PknK